MRLLILGQFAVHDYAHHWQGIRLGCDRLREQGRLTEVHYWDPRQRCRSRHDREGRIRYDKPSFEQMIADLKDLKPDVVLCCSVDSFNQQVRTAAKDVGALVGFWLCDIRTAGPDYLSEQVDLVMLSAGGYTSQFIENWHLPEDRVVYMPQACLKRAPGFLDHTGETKLHDGIFIGSAGPSPWHANRREVLKACKASLGDRFSWLNPQFDPEKATVTRKLPELYQRTRVSLGHSYATCWGYHSNRLFLAIGNGGFYLCNAFPGLEELFDPGDHLVTYSSELAPEQIAERLGTWVYNKDERERIRYEGFKAAQARHNYDLRMEQVVEAIEARR